VRAALQFLLGPRRTTVAVGSGGSGFQNRGTGRSARVQRRWIAALLLLPTLLVATPAHAAQRAKLRIRGAHLTRTRLATGMRRRRLHRSQRLAGPTAHLATAAGAIDPAHPWSTDFATDNFDQWSWWGQGQQNIWGEISVVKPAAVGVPPLKPSDSHIAQMTVTASGPAEGKVNAKLYKDFALLHDGTERDPSDISGTYSAWYYIPSSFRIHGSDWSNIFQFKEQYRLSDGSNYSVPLWWVQLGSVSWAREIPNSQWIGSTPRHSTQPVAFLNFWGNRWKRRITFDVVPLNRWFELTATVYAGNRTVYTLDGKPFDVAQASQYPVSPFRPTGDQWIFGVGNYATAPDTTLYLGKASYMPATAAHSQRAHRHHAHHHHRHRHHRASNSR
jgi:hypothetical protein